MIFLRKNTGLLMLIFLSFWAIRPLFEDGFFPMHDDTQVTRVFEMGKALKDGMFPVRWVADLGYGYGYPIFNFYAPVSYYFAGLLTLFGIDALVATKAMFVLGILLSGIFMYLLAREFWGELGGIVSGLFYIYAPYHAVDIYVRGDVAEVWAYAFIPLMSLGFYKVYRKSIDNHDLDTKISNIKYQISNIHIKNKKEIWIWIGIGSLGYAGAILSHNLTAMMVTPFLAIVILLYCYIAYKNKNLSSIFYFLFFILFVLMLSAFYWIPALWEMKYTNVLSQIGGGADFRDHFVCIGQLWNSPWGFGGSIPGCVDGMSFKIGKLYIAAVFVTLLLLLIGERFLIKKDIHSNDTYHYSDKHHNGRVSTVILYILGFIIAIFFTLEISKPIWEAIPLMTFFQYPWRFLILASFFSSFVAGFVVWFFQTGSEAVAPFRWHWFVTIVFIFLLIYPNSKVFQAQSVLSKTSFDYTNETTLKWTASKISDEYMPKDFKKPISLEEIAREKINVTQGKPEITTMVNRTNELRFLIDSKDKSSLKLNIAYFPAWNVFLDNQKISYSVLENGLGIVIPKGRHEVWVKFIETPIEKMANTLSTIGLLVLFIGIILLRFFVPIGSQNNKGEK